MFGYNRALSAAGGFSDRLSNTWTTALLVILGAVTYWMQIYINPTTCWTPAEFTQNHVDYTNRHCWYANRILSGFVLPEKRYKKYPVVFSAEHDELEGFVTLYQWIPLILVFQALAFILPYVIWNCGLSTLGVHPSKLFGRDEGNGNISNEDRIQVGRQMARYLYDYVHSSTMTGCPWGPISFLYIFMKILYVVNSVTQFSFYNNYLLENRWLDWTTDLNVTGFNYTAVFPKTVLCDFKIMRWNKFNQHTIQCEMHINQWYHWICAGIRSWLLIIMIFTLASFAIDVIKFILPIFRNRFMLRYLSMMERERHQPIDARVNGFSNLMGQDIVIILKIVLESTCNIIVGMTVIGLWDIHTGYAQTSQPSFPLPSVDTMSSTDPRGGLTQERGYVSEKMTPSRDDAVPFLRPGHVKNIDT